MGGVVVAAVAVTACGSSSGANNRSPSASDASSTRLTNRCSQPQAAPRFAASPASTRKLALVNLKGSTDYIVRDVTDIDHPFTVSSLGTQVGSSVQFVNAEETSEAAESTGLVRIPFGGSPETVVTTCPTRLFAWSPDGTAVAYVHYPQEFPRVEGLHIVKGGRDVLVDSIRNDFRGGCSNRLSCVDWSFGALYSPNGAYISLVEAPGTGLHLWTSSGKLVTSAEAATMPVWSGDALYWRDQQGVEQWRDGTLSLVLPGVAWLIPQASAAGGSIVYETRDAGTFTGRVHLFDTATRKTREIAKSRGFPAFLTSRYVWYVGERPCTPLGCLDLTTETGITYIYDLQTGTEYQSLITRVFDVWPHPA